MASLIYNSFLFDAITGAIDVDTDTFKLMLVTSSYSASKTHTKRSNVTNQVTGTGYTAGGNTVVITVAKSDVNSNVVITVPQSTWSSSTITARAGVVYKSRGGADTADELVCYIDFNVDIVSSSSTFTVNASTLTLQN